jgi:large subunit ribosomal protein L46
MPLPWFAYRFLALACVLFRLCMLLRYVCTPFSASLIPLCLQQRFFFKSQVAGTTKYHIGKCKDYAWVTKDELLEYFPENKDFFNKMIIHIR